MKKLPLCLLIEEDIQRREYLEKEISQIGMQCASISNTKNAVKYFISEAPDAVVLEYQNFQKHCAEIKDLLRLAKYKSELQGDDKNSTLIIDSFEDKKNKLNALVLVKNA